MTRSFELGELIDLVACDLEARPKGAPGFDALAPYVLRVARAPAELTIAFAQEAVAEVEAFAAAERLCCSTLGFEVERDPLVLTITAAPAQLDAMQQLIQLA